MAIISPPFRSWFIREHSNIYSLTDTIDSYLRQASTICNTLPSKCLETFSDMPRYTSNHMPNYMLTPDEAIARQSRSKAARAIKVSVTKDTCVSRYSPYLGHTPLLQTGTVRGSPSCRYLKMSDSRARAKAHNTDPRDTACWCRFDAIYPYHFQCMLIFIQIKNHCKI